MANMSVPLSPTQVALVKEIVASRYVKGEALDYLQEMKERHPEVLALLETVREGLGWKSSLSLCFKYYKVFPHLSLWRKAVDYTRAKANRFNILYILKAVVGFLREWREAAFQKSEAPSLTPPATKDFRMTDEEKKQTWEREKERVRAFLTKPLVRRLAL